MTELELIFHFMLSCLLFVTFIVVFGILEKGLFLHVLVFGFKQIFDDIYYKLLVYTCSCIRIQDLTINQSSVRSGSMPPPVQR